MGGAETRPRVRRVASVPSGSSKRKRPVKSSHGDGQVPGGTLSLASCLPLLRSGGAHAGLGPPHLETSLSHGCLLPGPCNLVFPSPEGKRLSGALRSLSTLGCP